MELQIYMAEIDPAFNSDLEVNYIGLVEKPAIERNWQAFKDQQQKAKFIINEEKRIISGPAMVANMPLYRNDNQLGEYYVVFGAPQIRQIVEKFSAKGYLKNFNLFHDENQKVEDVTIFNSFISDKELGVMPLAGFDDIEDGSWFISAKVNNPKVWENVKSGLIKGFSVEGIFNYVPMRKAKMSAAMTDSDLCFLMDMICNSKDALQKSVIVDPDSALYDFAQAIIKKQSAAISEMKSMIVDSIPSSMDMGRDAARSQLDEILSETYL